MSLFFGQKRVNRIFSFVFEEGKKWGMDFKRHYSLNYLFGVFDVGALIMQNWSRNATFLKDGLRKTTRPRFFQQNLKKS